MCSCSSTHTVVHIHIVYTNQTRRISCLCSILGQRVFFLWDLCDSAKKGLFESFRNEPNDDCFRVKVGFWFSFVDHYSRKIGSKNVDLHLGSGRPRPPWWRTTMLQPRRFLPARTRVISGREKRRFISVLILIMTTHYPYQHGNNTHDHLKCYHHQRPMIGLYFTSTVTTTHSNYLQQQQLLPT